MTSETGSGPGEPKPELSQPALGKPRTPMGFRLVAAVVRPGMNVLMGKEWRGVEKFPDTGFIAVANHVSEIDPLAVGHAIYRGGSTLHFLAKDSLFRVPGLRFLLRRLQQIPVSRGDRAEVGRSLEIAATALESRGAIVIYPEGTLTRDPDLWPMRAKTGAARLALRTGAPVIPVTHWGVNHFLAPYAKRPRLLPRQKYTLAVGDEIDLADLHGIPMTRTVLAEATQRIEHALTTGVAELRGEAAPEHIWDRAVNQRVPRNQLKARAQQTEERLRRSARTSAGSSESDSSADGAGPGGIDAEGSRA